MGSHAISQTTNPTVSVVVPVYNEIEVIKQFHATLLKTLRDLKKSYEIIYVDDNSTDGTYEWLQSVSMENSVIVVRKDGTKGKAYSLIQGFDMAKGDAFVMIDGDLQYPPERIPALLKALEKHDIAVAERKKYKDSMMRKMMSRTFRHLFGKMLFGLKTDIQSGLKAFKREVYELVKFQPYSPWTFDLEFLYRATQAGFSVKNVSIVFAPRLKGQSKINVVKSSAEIGLNALSIKAKGTMHFPIKPEKDSMRGAGIGYKKKKYVTHTTLPLSLSALETFTVWQKMYFIGMPILLIIAFILSPLSTIRVLVGILSVLYFVDALFNLYVISKSLQKSHEISFTKEELDALDESTLPMYTILCPLYKEAHVVPQFLEGISKIDWPKEKLDVMFLLEEDDKDTIVEFEKMNLPFYARTVIVPDSQPKTKPKACNYGLSYAKGEYLVIFDAEDIPDELQLKKAYLGFKKAPSNVKCLQAKLSYYNSRYNLLTRFFTAEYALWFDVTLPGLQSLNSALPLGGTSNHFETKSLLQLQGWDPFNVTEDADLGVRLFQKGYQTAVIDSTTYEEATSVSKNWLRQRSRWLKGYMQTYLVHMRHMFTFIKEKGLWHNLVFQMTVGGKILFVLLNPVMWILTAVYFIFRPIVGEVMELVYQPPISYIAVASWIFGNFMFIYIYMIGIAKRKQWDLAKYVFLIPMYWLMMSTAAMIALYQLILKPHYWEKTLHGFHLGRKENEEIKNAPVATPAITPVVQPVIPTASVSYLNLSAMIAESIVKSVLRWMPILLILNLDIMLAAFYLDTNIAQVYIALSLFGKAVFMTNTVISGAISTLTKNTKRAGVLFTTFLLHWISFVAFGLYGSYTIPALFGNTFNDVIPYVSFYFFGLFCLGMTLKLTSHAAKFGRYIYSIVASSVIALQLPLLMFHHESIEAFVRTFAYVGSVSLFSILLIRSVKPYARIMQNNVLSLFTLFDNDSAHKAWKSNQMRILIFNWRDTKHVYGGGAEVYIDEIASRWAKNGNKVTLFSGNDNQNAQYEVVNGIEVYRKGGTYTVYIFAVLYYLRKFRGKYDVIIDCENGIPFFMPLIAKEPVVLLIHHVHQEIFRKFLKFPMSAFAAFLEGKVMPAVYHDKQVITVSESSRKEILKLGFTKDHNVSIIPNGVNASLFTNIQKTTYPSFVYLGRLKEYKKVDTAIKAFAKVVRIHKDAKLEIVGSGESHKYLQSLVEEMNLQESIIFHGKVSESEKARLLGQSWAAIQPSQMEGWGITVIEANATGTPVIASNVQGLQDSVVDDRTGLLVQSGNAIAFANAMMRIIEEPEVRERLTVTAKQWATNFDWKSSAETFYNTIGKSIGQGTVTPALPDFLVNKK